MNSSVAHPARPRLLLVTRNFPPMWGGMERLNWHIAAELAKTFEVRVIAPAGAAQQAPAGVTVIEAPLKPLRRFLLRAASLARREARAWRPHIVLAGSGLTAPLAWWAVMALTIALVVTAELLNTAIEALCDHLHPQQHEAIKLTKDVAAGAVLIASLAALVVAMAFAADQVWPLLQRWLR